MEVAMSVVGRVKLKKEYVIWLTTAHNRRCMFFLSFPTVGTA